MTARAAAVAELIRTALAAADQLAPADRDALRAALVADDRLVDTGHVCTVLGISERNAIAMRQCGGGPPWCRIGRGRGSIRYSLSGLREWIAAQARRPGGAA